MTTRTLSNNCVTHGDQVFHEALDRILEFGRENGRDHPVVMNTTVAIIDALIALSDIEETPKPRDHRREELLPWNAHARKVTRAAKSD